jgi:hypothetical protein
VFAGGDRPGVARLAAVVMVCAALALGVAACGKGKSPGDKKTPVPATSPSIDASTAAAVAEVLGVYNGYLDLVRKANQTADYRLAMDQLPQYVAEPLLTDTVNGLYQMDKKGLAYEGTLVHTPKVTEVHLTRSPATAALQVCVDATNYRTVVKTNRSPLPNRSGPRRYLGFGTATLIEGKGWRITDSTSDGTQLC